MQKHIFIIGGTTFDHIVSLPTFPQPFPQTIHQAHLNETTGSTGAGKALCLTRLGVSNTLYSVLGNDSFGHQVIDFLKQEKVSFLYDVDPKGTERHINLMDRQGGRISIFVTQSSELIEYNFKSIHEQAEKADLLVLNILSYCKPLIPLVKKFNKPIWTDLHDYTDHNPYHEPFIEASDYIFLSSDNLPDYKKTMVDLLHRGKELIVCTHGKKGATALTKSGEWFFEPALTTFPLIDANGAGDNFFSGFLYAFLKNQTTDACLKYGTICGGYCISSSQLVNEELSDAKVSEAYGRFYD